MALLGLGALGLRLVTSLYTVGNALIQRDLQYVLPPVYHIQTIVTNWACCVYEVDEKGFGVEQ